MLRQSKRASGSHFPLPVATEGKKNNTFLFTQQMSWSQTLWKSHVNSSVDRSSENRWLVKVKTALYGWKKLDSDRLSIFFRFYICLFFLFFCSFFPHLDLFLRLRANRRTKAASVSTRIPSSRLPIFFSTSKVSTHVALLCSVANLSGGGRMWRARSLFNTNALKSHE